VSWAGEVYGRKRSMRIGCLIGIIGASVSSALHPLLPSDLTPLTVLMCAAQNIAMFLVSRFIMGWSSTFSRTCVALEVWLTILRRQSACSSPWSRSTNPNVVPHPIEVLWLATTCEDLGRHIVTGLTILHPGNPHCKQLYFGRSSIVRVLFRTLWQFPMALS
jgi:hypothetical protein